MTTNEFDLIVIGGGTGNTVASAAATEGLETALVEKGPLGGTCLNRGCNPSKMLIQHATVANRIRESERFSIEASIEEIRFSEFVRTVTETLADRAEQKEESKRTEENLTLFREETRFVDDHTIALGGEEYTAERIVVAAGSRPVIPDAIDGLESVGYLTSDDAVRLEERPERLVILGGGYIAAELGYYFDAFGTDVTMIEMLDTLLPGEDDEVAAAFTDIARERHTVQTGYQATAVEQADEEILVHAESDDDDLTVRGDELLVALGRRPNTDTINLEATTIETNDNGFIKTDEQLQTTAEDVWAMGDIADNSMFKHSGDYEGEVIIDNVAWGINRTADFSGLPHAIFTEPQIGAVGATEAELEDDNREYDVGKAAFQETAMGGALKLETGFVKVLATPDSGEILGCHIFGRDASQLIHEVTPAVRYGLPVSELANTLIHAHPALNKVIRNACKDIVS